MKLLLDEHISPLVTARLRSLGHDALAVAEVPDVRGGTDIRIRDAALAEDRVLVTYDLRDFGNLAARMSTAGTSHPGIVLVSGRRFSPSVASVGWISDALDALAAAVGEAGLRDRVAWLREAGGAG